MGRTEVLNPTYAHNMRLIGHSDQAGRSDGQQIMVRNGYAYIGHVCSKGFSVVDVSDPTNPKTVNYIPRLAEDPGKIACMLGLTGFGSPRDSWRLSQRRRSKGPDRAGARWLDGLPRDAARQRPGAP